MLRAMVSASDGGGVGVDGVDRSCVAETRSSMVGGAVNSGESSGGNGGRSGSGGSGRAPDVVIDL